MKKDMGDTHFSGELSVWVTDDILLKQVLRGWSLGGG